MMNQLVVQTSLRIVLVTETWPPEINGVALSIYQLVSGLKAKGHGISNTAQTSGISTIMKVNINNQSKYAGGVDPRREGIVLGNGAL